MPNSDQIKKKFNELTVGKDFSSKVLDTIYSILEGSISNINLSNEALGDDEIEAIAKAIIDGNTQSLQEINLACNKIRDNGAIALGNSLPALKSLEVFNVSSNSIKRHELHHLVESLQAMPSLQKISLGHNMMKRSEPSYTLGPYLAELPSLQEVHMSHVHGIDRQLFRSLEPALQANRDRIAKAKKDAESYYKEIEWDALPENAQKSIVADKHGDLLLLEGRVQAAAGQFMYAISIMGSTDLDDENEAKTEEINFSRELFLDASKDKLQETITKLDVTFLNLSKYLKFYYQDENYQAFVQMCTALEGATGAINKDLAKLIFSYLQISDVPDFYVYQSSEAAKESNAELTGQTGWDFVTSSCEKLWEYLSY